jgi:hypothetical protein
MDEEKKRPSPKELGMIAVVIAAVVIAAVVIGKTVNANRVHDVIVIKGAKGAKPMPGDPEYGASSSGLGGASDRPFPNNSVGGTDASDRPFPTGGNAPSGGAKGQ